MVAAAQFFNEMSVCYAGVCSAYKIPWVTNFDSTDSPAVVLTVDLGTSLAGLYTYDAGTQRWQLVMPYADVGSYVADSWAFAIHSNVQVGQTYPPGVEIYRNGRLIAGTQVTADPLAVYAVMTPAATGGGGGGGNAAFGQSNFPGDLPAPIPSDPDLILYNGAAPASEVKLQTLRSLGGTNLGMVIVGLV